MTIGTYTSSSSTVDRAIDVLEALRDSPEPVGVRDLARRVGISPATAHRLLTSLRLRGLVVQPNGSRAYTLGLGLLDYANAVLGRIELPNVAGPVVRTLRDQTNETVTVQVPVGGDRVCVYELEGTHEVRRRVGVGRRVPLQAGASGRAILAFMGEDEVKHVLDAASSGSPASVTKIDHQRTLELLEAVRREGVAFSDSETVDGVSSMASPLLDAAGAVVGSIAVSGPSSRWNAETMRVHVPALVEAAAGISRLLGYRGSRSSDSQPNPQPLDRIGTAT